MPFKSIFPSIPVENEPYGKRILESFLKNPTKKAFIYAQDPTKFITYKELHDETIMVSVFLEKNDFGHKDIAVLFLPNSWEFVEILTAVSLRGGAFSAICVIRDIDGIQHQLEECEAKIIFCSDDKLNIIKKAIKNCKISPKIVVCQLSSSNQTLTESSTDNGNIPPNNIINFSTIISDTTSLNTLSENIEEKNIDVKKDIFVIQYTSGTTGPPKGVMLSHQNYSTETSIFINHFDKYVYPRLDPNWRYENEATILLQAFCSGYGLSILLKSIICGQTCILCGQTCTDFDKSIFFKAIQDFKYKYTIRELFLIPPTLSIFIHDPSVDNYDLTSLEFFHLSAAPTSESISQKVYKKLKNLKRIERSYGTSECSFSAITNPIYPKSRDDIAGTLCSNFEMKIIDENGEELSEDEKGELCTRGPTTMIGYLKNSKKTAEAIDSEGWFHCAKIII
uniref:AMP-dependent synthetase/ligase domain-containing protein n=1 Tax=Panagrolaimus superbus TaxID=310955 RepID=A0A914Z3J6_9BILA